MEKKKYKNIDEWPFKEHSDIERKFSLLAGSMSLSIEKGIYVAVDGNGKAIKERGFYSLVFILFEIIVCWFFLYEKWNYAKHFPSAHATDSMFDIWSVTEKFIRMEI